MRLENIPEVVAQRLLATVQVPKIMQGSVKSLTPAPVVKGGGLDDFLIGI